MSFTTTIINKNRFWQECQRFDRAQVNEMNHKHEIIDTRGPQALDGVKT